MPRPLPAPIRDQMADSDLPAYERAIAYWGGMFVAPDASPEEIGRANPWAAALLHSPRFAAQRAELSDLLRTAPDRPGSFSHADREWVGMVLAAHTRSYGVAAIHAAEAVRVGVPPTSIEALFAGDTDRLSSTERLTARYIRAVADGVTSDVDFDAMQAHLGTRGTVEYTYYITMIWTVIRQFQVFGGAESTPAQVIDLARQAELVR